MIPAPALRLVLDTNVVLDLLHFGETAISPIRQVIERGEAQCYASQDTLAELSRVLAYPEFQLDASTQTAVLSRYLSWTGDAHPKVASRCKLPRCSDPDDQMFLELAASTQADFLISKDKAVLAMKRFALGFQILEPREAAALFASKY